MKGREKDDEEEEGGNPEGTQNYNGQTKSEEESMRTVVDCTTLTRIINSYTHIAHQVYCWYSFCNRAHHSFFKFFY